ncbi:tetratricopeptide repeat protein [Limnobacter sp.]|uniref:tetratricopeptide repeat protein n=1 Tax=Limnobacter sp. TaxID=2003368 RepID=UPI0027358D16|nr:tetratricopeptide repeat protein [Limnobacter sp.]MDP3270355.1 tetratricopeptide repeat protein [Limnobacter sp.]
MTRIWITFCAVVTLVFSNLAMADWFLSSDTKMMIEQAEAGDAMAQYKVGVAYDFGKGAPRDVVKAKKWYELAANQGHAEAQNSLGSIFQEEKRYEEALLWFERASSQGHVTATNNLAYLYDFGLGVQQDRRKGFEIYSKAADLGSALAMWNIANMYGDGQIGEKDLVNACIWAKWARKFSTSKEHHLQDHLDRVLPQIKRMLSAEQVNACNDQTEGWLPLALRGNIGGQ